MVTDQSVKQPFMKSSHLYLKPEILEGGLTFRIGKYIKKQLGFKQAMHANACP